MKILYVTSEIVPFSKTGGLADVAGALPKALKEIGHDIRVYTPRYKDVPTAIDPGFPVFFFEDQRYFGSRAGLYQLPGGIDYPDNLERFAAFCQGAFPLLKQLRWKPDVIHCNDWQSALVIMYLKLKYKADPSLQRIATVYSVHNLGYLGMFDKNKLPATGFGWEVFKQDGLEFWDHLALAKAGFVYADVINTVSPTYAREIQTAEYGCGLDGLLRARAHDLYGIINGIDYDLWNPATDQNIPKRFSPATIVLKAENKLALQKANSLPQKKEAPVIGMIARLADQKGLDILAGALEGMMKLGCQFVVLGTGDKKYHELLTELKKKYPDQLGINLKFDAAQAELIYAGADLFLMPSRYEPCGLGQLISFKYGTVPIVRKTGGLADTVHDFNAKTAEGEGFVFTDYSAKALLAAVKRAVETYHKKMLWVPLQTKIMDLDYSWDASAKQYVSLYMKALAKVGLSAL
ncbi:MAG: glycogen synthase [Candidatus Margulisbacteria bacterium]|jgi:starch synthase|nr:glycogen synthase [Candidatus Margulisiibacteriota bacterium]